MPNDAMACYAGLSIVYRSKNVSSDILHPKQNDSSELFT
jgi:hypothetical protein